jgi:hypothetical protein
MGRRLHRLGSNVHEARRRPLRGLAFDLMEYSRRGPASVRKRRQRPNKGTSKFEVLRRDDD